MSSTTPTLRHQISLELDSEIGGHSYFSRRTIDRSGVAHTLILLIEGWRADSADQRSPKRSRAYYVDPHGSHAMFACSAAAKIWLRFVRAGQVSF
jgi:hypothetical protein